MVGLHHDGRVRESGFLDCDGDGGVAACVGDGLGIKGCGVGAGEAESARLGLSEITFGEFDSGSE